MAGAGQLSLAQRLAAYDGRAVTLLSEAQADLRDTPGFLADLTALCGSETATVSEGATWILKAELEAGHALDADHTKTLVAILHRVQAWQAQLHLCQCLDRLPLTADQAATVLDWAAPLRAHKRPFLRAWSLHLRVTLARAHGLSPEAADADLETASQDQAASVRARARNLRNP